MLDIGKLTRNKETNLLEFSSDLDLSHVTLWGDFPFKDPVIVHGTIQENIEEYILSFKVSYKTVLPCARCLTEVNKSFTNEYTHMLRETGEDLFTEDKYIPISNGKLNLALVVTEDLLLDMEEAPLCKPDCSGICPVCGGNRNEEPCECRVEIPDPRFDVLRKLLDNKQTD